MLVGQIDRGLYSNTQLRRSGPSQTLAFQIESRGAGFRVYNGSNQAGQLELWDWSVLHSRTHLK